MLPIAPLLPELVAILGDTRRMVLQAPPGAGKTTGVPPALFRAPWLGEGRVLMLEPRRLAARAAARRMAAERGESVGTTIGFRVRGEARVSAATRIEVVTEGILTRMLQDDPSLPGVGVVLFDEFHERSLIGDTGLALVLGATTVLRDDLRVVVMSATLDGAAVARMMGDAPVLTSASAAFPVVTRFAPPPQGGDLEAHVATVVREALAGATGSVLVFLPGAREIHRVAERLRDAVPSDTDVRPLYGAMSNADQDAAIAPAPPGRRKVVLATNVAETSLTIEGIVVVVDSGFERLPRFSPRTGMTRLETRRITRASADQRRGRAGRTGPGIAIRCWSAAEDAGLVPAARAEILDADLAPLALDLAAAGFPEPGELPWIDPPPQAAFAVGRELLHRLGALDGEGRLTPHGSAMARFGAHPRLAHLLLRAADSGAATAARASVLVALLEERDILRGDGRAPPTDLRLRVDAVERDLDSALLAGATLDRGAAARVRDAAREWRRRLDPAPGGGEAASVGALVALAFPERIAQRRESAGRFLTAGGRGARLHGDDPLAHEEWLAIAELDDVGSEGRVLLAAPLEPEDASAIVARDATVETMVTWDAATQGVLAVERTRLGAITLREVPLRSPDPARVREALLTGIAAVGVAELPWPESATRLRQRLGFLHAHDAAWPDVSDAALGATVTEWLGPDLEGVRRLEQLRDRLEAALLRRLDWGQRASLDRLAPERISVPSGSRIALDYADPLAPVLAVRLQEVFGMAETPRLLDGAVPVVMQLLSPARRPVQQTRDLASFWRSGYFDVRKDLRGRYPRHHWPEDPLAAEAVRGTKRRETRDS